MSIAIIVAIFIAIIAFLLILEPQNVEQNSLQIKLMKRQFISSKHKWQDSQLKGLYFCTLCSKMTSGLWSKLVECRKCGIIIHRYCKYMNIKKPQCKFIITSNKNRQNKTIHQWRQGIHSINSICSYCQLVCNGLQAYVCLWCHRQKHGNCKDQGICDLGELKNIILSPNQVKCEDINFTQNVFESLRKKKKKLKQKTSDQSETERHEHEDIKFTLINQNKSPIIILINKKSGGQSGNQYLKSFYHYLNPLQVISILDQGLQRLKIFEDIKNLKLIVGGGDGTVCSVLNYLKSGAIQKWVNNNPPVAILPLGTGNDLSRSLGWGSGGEQRDAKLFLLQVQNQGRTVLLDRWMMKISNPQIPQEDKQYTIYNYLGIGLDAKVCYQFHKMRQKYPSLFVSQFSNKLIYTQMGTMELFKYQDQNLQEMIQIFVDDKKINLKGLQNVVLLNIMHWSGGATDLWKQIKQFKKQSINDGLIEILGVTDMIHLGQIQIGLDLPLQIAQGKKIKIQSIKSCKLAFQIDGEPFELSSPFIVNVEYKDKVYMQATHHPAINQKVLKIMGKALSDKMINEEQYQYIIGKLEE